MLIKILYSFLVSTFLIVPFLYKSKHPAMLDFYCNMAMSFAFRKIYTRMLLLFLLAFHFYHLTIFQNHYDLIPSSVLCFAMFSHSLCERGIYFLQEHRILWAGMILSLACLFIPHFMPLGVSIGMLLCGTVFYPGRMFREILFVTEMTKHLKNQDDLEEIADGFFCWGNSKSCGQHKSKHERKLLLNDEIEDAEFVEIEKEQDNVQS